VRLVPQQYVSGASHPEYARLMSFDLSVLINDGLNLPEKLPNPSKGKGSGRLSKAVKKR
jgi:hypothetical protein